VLVFSRQVPESDADKVGRSFRKHLRSHCHVVAAHDDLLGFSNSLFEKWRRDRTFVHVEERHVVIGDLVKQNDELDEVRVGLLPERLFSAAEEVV